MKSEKGVTLVTLVVYICVLTVVISLVAAISTFFIKNMDKVKDQDKYAAEYNHFNMFFINDVKNNKSAEVEEQHIKFDDDTEYKLIRNCLYRNGTIIAQNVEKLKFSYEQYTAPNTTTEKNLINVTLAFEKASDYEKTIQYVLKYW